MAAGLSAAVAHARRTVAPDARTDGAALTAFVADRDAAAFAELVARFGPMVFAGCRRVTRRHHDAEDAFQAVFVVLARRAAAVAPPEAVGGWLYGVAVRIARAARKTADRRAAREHPLPGDVCEGESSDPDLAELLAVELAALSERDRTLLVRCDLRDEPQTAVAAALGVPVGTVYSRLAAARKRLAARLAARGLGVGGLAALGSVALPSELAAHAVTAALDHTPAAVAALSHGVCRGMLVRKLAPAALALVAVAALTAGLFAAQPAPAAAPAPRAAAVQLPVPQAKAPNRIVVWKAGRFVLLDPDGKNEVVVAEQPTAERYATEAKLSPDGTRLAHFARPGEPTPDRVWPRGRLLVRTIGARTPPLDTGVECRYFHWSPDGSQLVAATSTVTREGLQATHTRLDARTGKGTPLTLPANHVVTRWVSDGRFAAMSISTGGGKLVWGHHLINADGTEVKRLADGDSLGGFAAPSPDGTRAFRINYADAVRLDRMDFDTGRETAVEESPFPQVGGVCWAPDGRRIAYTRGERRGAGGEAVAHLVVADPDGKNAQTILTARAAGAIALGAPDWR
ncbi:MAG: sigma-70 family RNA polymerase sigma factor [Gemmataceae bacterium]